MDNQKLRKKLDLLFQIHAGVAIFTGFICLILPHSFASSLIGANYSHVVLQ